MERKNSRYNKWLVGQLKSGWSLVPKKKSITSTYSLEQRGKTIHVPKRIVKSLIKQGVLVDGGHQVLLRSSLNYYAYIVLKAQEDLAYPIQLRNFSSTPNGRKILARLKKYNGSLF